MVTYAQLFHTIQLWDIPSYSSLFPDVRKVFDSVEDVCPATLTVFAVLRCSVSADKPGTAAQHLTGWAQLW